VQEFILQPANGVNVKGHAARQWHFVWADALWTRHERVGLWVFRVGYVSDLNVGLGWVRDPHLLPSGVLSFWGCDKNTAQKQMFLRVQLRFQNRHKSRVS